MKPNQIAEAEARHGMRLIVILLAAFVLFVAAASCVASGLL